VRPERFELPTFWFVGGLRTTQQPKATDSNQRNQQKAPSAFGWFRLVLYPVHGKSHGKFVHRSTKRLCGLSADRSHSDRSPHTNIRRYRLAQLGKSRRLRPVSEHQSQFSFYGPSTYVCDFPRIDAGSYSSKPLLVLDSHPGTKRGNSTIGQMLVLVGRRTCKSGSAKTGGLRPARASFVSASNQLQNGDHREQNFVFKAQKSLSASPCIPDMRLQAYEHTGLAGIFRVGFRVCGSGHHAS
jgi:hypothetical protein